MTGVMFADLVSRQNPVKLVQKLCPKTACTNRLDFYFVSHLLNLGNTTIADFTAEHSPEK